MVISTCDNSILEWSCDLFSNPCQHLPKPLYLLQRVVMHRTHAHHATGILQPQARGDLQGIVIPIPHVNIGFIQLQSEGPPCGEACLEIQDQA
jgi:hypothetical protein